MRILVVPDSFTGTLSAAQAASAISTGWQKASPNDQIVSLAISDGGPGFVNALLTDPEFSPVEFQVEDLLNRRLLISAAVSEKPIKTFYLESAQIVGTHLVADQSPKQPHRYSSYGIGQAIDFAIENDARKIVVGLGGTAVIDAGAGLLAALGGEPNAELKSGGAALAEITKLDLTKVMERLSEVEIVIAADVDVPLLGLRGAVQGFGPQKGATPEIQQQLETAFTHFSSLFPKQKNGKDASLMLGAGAAGGIGFALLAVGAKKVAGFEFVAAALNLEQQIKECDLVVTGEGKFDWQSMQGKAISQLAQLCLGQGKPLLVLAGQVDVGRREWSAIGVVGTYGCSDDGEIPSNPAKALQDLAVRVARTFSPTSWQN